MLKRYGLLYFPFIIFVVSPVGIIATKYKIFKSASAASPSVDLANHIFFFCEFHFLYHALMIAMTSETCLHIRIWLLNALLCIVRLAYLWHDKIIALTKRLLMFFYSLLGHFGFMQVFLTACWHCALVWWS